MADEASATVMVVDDHPIWRDAVARDLAEDGFSVVATADGVAGTDRSRSPATFWTASCPPPTRPFPASRLHPYTLSTAQRGLTAMAGLEAGLRSRSSPGTWWTERTGRE